MPSWLTAYWLFSLAVTQPPRMWTSSRYRSSVAYIGRIARRCGGRSFATWIDGEAAVADAPHADAAGAPRLGREPLHGVVPVERLGLGVLVERHARRAAGPRTSRRHNANPRAASHSPRPCPSCGASCPCRTGSSRGSREALVRRRRRGAGSHRFADSSRPSRTGIRTSQRTSCSKGGSSIVVTRPRYRPAARGAEGPREEVHQARLVGVRLSMTAACGPAGTIQNRRRSTPEASAASRSSSASCGLSSVSASPWTIARGRPA